MVVRAKDLTRLLDIMAARGKSFDPATFKSAIVSKAQGLSPQHLAMGLYQNASL